jgi:mannose-6-phosphate isomerase-like protein (cupin superfamily)
MGPAMPIYTPTDSTDFTTHGSTFAAYVTPGRGSTDLCAWRLIVAPDVAGAAHRPNREEVLLVLDGVLHVTVDGHTQTLGPGAVIHVPAQSLLQIDTSTEGGSAWVTTTHGLTATLGDGTTITPPWAQ